MNSPVLGPTQHTYAPLGYSDVPRTGSYVPKYQKSKS